MTTPTHTEHPSQGEQFRSFLTSKTLAVIGAVFGALVILSLISIQFVGAALTVVLIVAALVSIPLGVIFVIAFVITKAVKAAL